MLGLVFSFLLAAIVSPLLIRLYKHYGWVDDPKKQSHAKVLHERAVPRGGGLVVFFAILIPSLVFLQVDSYLISILCGAAILALMGFLDDLYNVHPLLRLFTNTLAALLVVSSGIGIEYVSNPFGSGVISLDYSFLGIQLADFLAVLFIIWNINIVNWSKGVDGQLPGFVAMGAVVIGILSYRFIDDPTSFNTAQLSFIVAGSYLGFLLWNFYPQKIMPGYGAGSLAGYFLTVLAILSGAKLATALMILAIPTADAVFTILRRIRAGKSPIWGDRGHLHHKLMDVLGWSRRRIAVFYWVTSLALGLLSLYLNTFLKLFTIVLVGGLVFAFLIWAKLQTAKK